MTDIDQTIGQEVTGRICTKCNTFKLFAEFNKKSKAKYGVYNECRECQKISNKITYDKYGPASRVAAIKARRATNPDQRKSWDAAYRERNPDKVKESIARHYENNPDALEMRKKKVLEWQKANPDKVKEIRRRAIDKAMTKVENRIHGSVSRAMRSGLAKGGKEGRSTFNILGYTRESLMAHLEKQFLQGMSWDNYGLHGWHIDHIIPKSLFKFESIHDPGFKLCWSLENLQPLWAKDNRKKFNKYDGRLPLADNDNAIAKEKSA